MNVALEEGHGVLVDVQREAVMRTLAVVAVNARGHAVLFDVFPDAFQLVLGAVLQVEECLQADFTALIAIQSDTRSLLPFSRLFIYSFNMGFDMASRGTSPPRLHSVILAFPWAASLCGASFSLSLFQIPNDSTTPLSFN